MKERDMPPRKTAVQRGAAANAEQLRALARQQHTHDSFSRAILAHALRIAASARPAADGSITVPGTITFMPASHSEPGGWSCWTATHCWEDAERRQSICVEMEMCFGLAVQEQ